MILHYIIVALAILFIAGAIWHGWSVEVGNSSGFHFKLYQLPLKRFFKKP